MGRRKNRREESLFDLMDASFDALSGGDAKAAEQHARAALELDPGLPEAHVALGGSLIGQRRMTEALEAFGEALKLDPNYAAACLGTAEALFDLGDFQQAFRMASEGVELAGDDDELTDALLLVIDTLLAQNRREEAAEVCTRFPQLSTEHAPTEFMIGRALVEVGERQAGLLRLESALAAGFVSADLYYFLGLAREGNEDTRGAVTAFLQARQLDVKAPRESFAESSEAFEARVAAVLGTLPQATSALLDGALILIEDLPGSEVVSEGVDPRTPLLCDDIELAPGDWMRRCFVYQRNIERLVTGTDKLDELISQMLHEEASRVWGGR